MRQALRILIPFLPMTELALAALCFFALTSPGLLVSIDPKILYQFNFLIVGEFLFVHSGAFFAVLVGASKMSLPVRAGVALILFFIYGLFIWFIGEGLIPIYIALTISRTLSAFTDSDDIKSKEIAKAGVRATLYLLSILPAMIAPFGFISLQGLGAY